MCMFRALTAREIDCRVAQISKDKKGLSLLLYKDARCDQNILDETVGAMNWQRKHGRDNANCIVSIWDAEKGQWIEKEDTGTESNTEAEKGLASDSFKRACVNWGIGRELYTAPFIWIAAKDCNIDEWNGKLICKDKFEVTDIAYNDNREISRLTIYNVTKRTTAYIYKAGEKPQPEPEGKSEEKAKEEKAKEEKKKKQQLGLESMRKLIFDNLSKTPDLLRKYEKKYGIGLSNVDLTSAGRILHNMKELGEFAESAT